MPHRPRLRARLVAATCLVLGGQAVLVASVPLAGSGSGVPTPGLRVALAEPGGSRPPLVPGAAVPLDLTVSNPYAVAVQVTALGVRVGTVRPLPPVGCGADAFTTADGRFAAFTVPARSSATLSTAGVPADQWPRVGMPAAAGERTGCRGLELTLDFSARARFA